MENDSDCTCYCHCKAHGDEINSVICVDYDETILKAYICSICKSPGKVKDSKGRTALHATAIYGKTQMIPWLINELNADVNARDTESGYTPLHISIYKGFIDVTILLLKHGADASLLDKEFYSPIDMLSEFPVAFPNDPRTHLDVCIYGSNKNFNLGTGNQEPKSIAERHDFLYKFHEAVERLGDLEFSENDTALYSIQKVYMSDYHTIFINNMNDAFACGHGTGGRLGIGSQETALTPKPIKTKYKISGASIARYHTVLMTSTHQVMTCGMNNYYQLGHKSAPEMLIVPKFIDFDERMDIHYILAARCHTLLWNKFSGYFLICGLNGGQFGLDDKLKSIITPMKVKFSYLNIPSRIKEIKSSDGAIIILNYYDELYLLTNFQCTKIKSRKQFDISKGGTGKSKDHHTKEVELFEVHGGCLKSSLLNDYEQMDELIRVVVYMNDKKIYLWDNNGKNFTRCFFSNWYPTITHFYLNNKEILFIANGHAYMGNFIPTNKNKVSKNNENKLDKDTRFLEKSECIEISKKRIQYLYRPVYLTSDPKGDNYCALQKKAYNNIWSKISPEPPTGYLPEMLKLILNCKEENNYDIILQINDKEFFAHKYILASRSKYFAQLFENNSSSIIRLPINLNEHEIKIFYIILIYMYTRILCIDNMKSFYLQYFKKSKFSFINEFLVEQNFIKLDDFKSIAERFEIKITLQDISMSWHLNPFFQMDFPLLYDIKLASMEGEIFEAHKCILFGRNEYFKICQKYSTSDIFHTNFTSSELKLFFEFIYTESFTKETKMKTSTKLFSDLLVVSDYLRDDYLKHTCSLILAHSITFQNISYLYDLSKVYKDEYLCQNLIEYILNNLIEFLEKRQLINISDDFMKEILYYYHAHCNYIQNDLKIANELDIKAKNKLKNFSHTRLSFKNIKEKPKSRRRKNSYPPKLIENQTSPVLNSLNNQSNSNNNRPSLSTSPNNEEPFISMSEFPDLTKSLEKSTSHSSVLKGKSKYTSAKPVKFSKLKSNSFIENTNGFINLSINKLLSNDLSVQQSSSNSDKKTNPWDKIDLSLPKEETLNNSFNDIVIHEQKKKTNFNKMKTKPLHLTQLEDKAIYELLSFYNASNSYDENISVFRSDNEPMSLPKWINPNKSKS